MARRKITRPFNGGLFGEFLFGPPVFRKREYYDKIDESEKYHLHEFDPIDPLEEEEEEDDGEF